MTNCDRETVSVSVCVWTCVRRTGVGKMIDRETRAYTDDIKDKLREEK